jgi:hypothetical protein
MTQIGATEGIARNKAVIWLLVGAGLLLVVFANIHLVYVAASTQPDCVAHLRPGNGASERGQFSAAGSSCSQEGTSMIGPKRG